VSGDIVERLRRWDDGRISTHYEGCWDSHPVCAILLAADAIEARDAEIERLRAVLNAIDALHQPYPLGDGRTSEDCDECGDRWPCPTARLLHPMTLDEAIDTLGTVHK